MVNMAVQRTNESIAATFTRVGITPVRSNSTVWL